MMAFFARHPRLTRADTEDLLNRQTASAADLTEQDRLDRIWLALTEENLEWHPYETHTEMFGNTPLERYSYKTELQEITYILYPNPTDYPSFPTHGWSLYKQEHPDAELELLKRFTQKFVSDMQNWRLHQPRGAPRRGPGSSC